MSLTMTELDTVILSLQANEGLQKLKQRMGWPDASMLAEAIKLRLLPFALGSHTNMLYAVAITKRSDSAVTSAQDQKALDAAKMRDVAITHFHGTDFIVTYAFPR